MASFQFTDTKNQPIRQNEQDRKIYLQLGLALFEPGAARAGFLKRRIKPIKRIQVRCRPELILDTRTLRIVSVFISHGPGTDISLPVWKRVKEKTTLLEIKNRNFKYEPPIQLFKKQRS